MFADAFCLRRRASNIASIVGETGEGKELALFSLIGVAGREELQPDNGGSEFKSLETVLFSGLLVKMFDMM
jgi:hypothetical protein